MLTGAPPPPVAQAITPKRPLNDKEMISTLKYLLFISIFPRMDFIFFNNYGKLGCQGTRGDFLFAPDRRLLRKGMALHLEVTTGRGRPQRVESGLAVNLRLSGCPRLDQQFFHHRVVRPGGKH